MWPDLIRRIIQRSARIAPLSERQLSAFTHYYN